MRWSCWILALLAAAGLTNTPSASSGAGPACASSFNLVPGCCECPPSCCDNAWVGYCEEKARWQGFWTRMGTGAGLARWSRPACATCPTAAAGCGSPDVATPTRAAVPMELADPAPLPPDSDPAPEKATWRLPLPRIFWLR